MLVGACESVGMYLLIDTTEVHRRGFAFGTPEFAKLASFAEQGILTVLLPDVIEKEWQGHLEEHVRNKFRSAMKAIGSIAKIADDEHDLAGVQAQVNELAEKARNSLNEFVGADGIVRLSSSDIDIAPIVDDYFAERAPFGGKDKKSEFPDAIVLAIVRKFAQENQSMVYLVSHDNDMRAGCERFADEITQLDSLAAALSEALRINNKTAVDLANQALDLGREELVKCPLQEVLDAPFSLWDDSRIDAEIEDVEVDDVLESKFLAIDIDSDAGRVEVSGNLKLRINAVVHSDDEDYVYRDPDTKSLVYLETTSETIYATVEVVAHGFMDLTALLNGEYVWGSSVDLTPDSIPIYEFAVTDRRSSADDWAG